MAHAKSPAFSEVECMWRESRCLTKTTIEVYRSFVQRFLEYCRNGGLQPRRELTYAGTTRFLREYVQRREIDAASNIENGRSALRRWSKTLQALGEVVPPWKTECAPLKRHRTVLLEEYAEHMRRYRGSAHKTVAGHCFHVEHLLGFLRNRRRSLRRLRLADIDALLVECRRHWSVRTVADLCVVLRGFVRFLFLTGRLKVDLSGAILAPLVRKGNRPLRALPWPDVQRVLRGIDRRTRVGRRDYALLLMMSLYGCGAGESIRLELRDIDWQAGTVRVVRPKTGVEILLPLLPVMARAFSDYLRHGRPRNAATRAVFVRMPPPHTALASSSAVRHILCRCAARARVKAAFLGSHALRHAHACRQMELGTRPKLIGDILGHRDPESTSAYLRVATERLRELALPVPR